MVKQSEGGGAAAGGGGDVVWVSLHGAALPLTAAVLSRSHHLALSILHVHRPFHTVPGKNTGVVRPAGLKESNAYTTLCYRAKGRELINITDYYKD